jgi:hypothetical protein
MKPTATIRLLTETKNEKGDVFNRLMENLFFSLGYDNLRLNVQKQGREIDVQGDHRHEPRILRAECKAHEGKMGGSELNKFFGAVTRERKKAKKNKQSVSAYFISLGGFTETGIDQEDETGVDKIILFNSADVIKELEKSRLLVGDAEATSQAGQCVQVAGAEGLDLDEIEVLGHDMGFVKAVYYETAKQRTHFALIHAEGKPLAEAVAQQIIEADAAGGGVLYSLQYLPPRSPRPNYKKQKEEALVYYQRWLAEECGYIQLDGMPTDNELGPRKLELERLFVPLNVIMLSKEDDQEPSPDAHKPRPIRDLLTDAAHIALLASPGGGKSTLLKRLATAYAFPQRRSDIADDLPAHNWLPLFVRCRELQEQASLSITALLGDISIKAEMPADLVEAFRALVDESLQGGQVLLLVDGLDEISEERLRVTFANNLRSFLGVFPQTALVVTSREAGFRLVAGTIAGACHHQARLAPFDYEDVHKLCVQWHIEVIKDSPSVRMDAEKLALDIWGNERIRALAENPLLLTTLLVVKRWIGELPRNRAALYGVAVQVLVRTWNVEGYEPLDEEETLAQLSYVACAMMEDGVQQISHNALLKLLRESRQVLEAELRYVAISPTKFIERVESRSSLLMQTGRAVVEGELQPVYEFRHLTFQEYLSARGYVKEQHAQRNDEIPLVKLLSPHFHDERWREVIPLAAVLAERKAENTIKELIAYSLADIKKNDDSIRHDSLDLLVKCIVDEVKISSATLISALEVLGMTGDTLNVVNVVEALRASKVGELFQAIIENKYASAAENWESYASSLAELYYPSDSNLNNKDFKDLVDDVIISLKSPDRTKRIKGALQLMSFSYERSSELPYYDDRGEKVEVIVEDILFGQAEQVKEYLIKMLEVDDKPLILAASWALSWSETSILTNYPLSPDIIGRLLEIWYQNSGTDIARFAAWAFTSNPLLNRDALNMLNLDKDKYDNFIMYNIDNAKNTTLIEAAITLAWYQRSPLTEQRIAELIKDTFSLDSHVGRRNIDLRNAKEMLETLGETGARILQEYAKIEAEAAQRMLEQQRVTREAASF